MVEHDMKQFVFQNSNAQLATFQAKPKFRVHSQNNIQTAGTNRSSRDRTINDPREAQGDVCKERVKLKEF